MTKIQRNIYNPIKNMKIRLLFLFSVLFSQTPDQIKQVKDYVKQSGMTDSQAKAAARARGISDAQINAVLEKDKETTKSNVTRNFDTDISSNRSEVNKNTSSIEKPIFENNITKKADEIIDPLKNLKKINDETYDGYFDDPKLEISHFGYDIFKRDPEIFQLSSVGAVDPDYLIGPGDEIIVMLWGETQFRQVLTVDREGFVFIPEIGQVFVNGLNFNLLESKLFRVLSQSYASLNPIGREPSTFLDISLGNLRPLRVQVIGEVNQPGAYIVSPSTTLFSSLYYFNGPTILGSLRNIKLIRDNLEITDIDFYDYLTTGKKIKDEKLQLDDIIFIPKRLKTVSIFGEVMRPGIYELKDSEGLLDFLEIAGGLKITAYLNRAQIDRVISFEDRLTEKRDRSLVDIDLEKMISSKNNFNLNDGDKLEIFSIEDVRSNIVSINGSISRPGQYDLGSGLTISQLINKADGITGDAYKDRVDLIRVDLDFNEILFKLNLDSILMKNDSHDINLKNMDNVRIYSNTEITRDAFVSITGATIKPGQYELQKNMTLYDLLFKSGLNPVDKEYKKEVFLPRGEIVRFSGNNDEKKIIPFNVENVLNKEFGSDDLLKNGDHIHIYKLNEIVGERKFVKIEGHVKRPGTYELYEGNMTLFDMIFKAGGYDDIVFKSKTFLDRADLIRLTDDGVGKKIIPFDLGALIESKENNFKLLPGDQINVYSNETLNSVKYVTIQGAINIPGEYELRKGMTVKDLILQSGGVTKNMYKYKIEIARVDPDKLSEAIYGETISLDMFNDYSLSSVEYSTDSKELVVSREEFQLMPYDYINIHPDPYFLVDRKVTIQGAVHYPGAYIIQGPDETISEIIKRAGGLMPNAYPFASTFTRNGKDVKIDLRKILKGGKKNDIKIQNNDSILIAKKPTIVEIDGEVNTPGNYKFIRAKRASKYISYAGGFSQDADQKNVWIEYPNGRSKRYRRFLSNPIIYDGSKIIVGKKKEEEPFDSTEYAKELTAILANLAQALSLILLVRS